MKFKWYTLTVLLLLLSLGVVACGDDADDEGDDADTEEQVDEATDETNEVDSGSLVLTRGTLQMAFESLPEGWALTGESNNTLTKDNLEVLPLIVGGTSDDTADERSQLLAYGASEDEIEEINGQLIATIIGENHVFVYISLPDSTDGVRALMRLEENNDAVQVAIEELKSIFANATYTVIEPE